MSTVLEYVAGPNMALHTRLALVVTLGILYVTVSEVSGCEGQWFGSYCQYRCHCDQNEPCDYLAGLCSTGCKGGWFGPNCQYKDVAYKPGDQTRDGSDGTCEVQSSVSLHIQLEQPLRFTWLRLVFGAQASTVTLEGKALNSPVKPIGALQVHNKSDLVYDFHGEFKSDVDALWLTFTHAGVNVCSVLVSGGRNVALRQHAEQTVTLKNHLALFAVDGDINPLMQAGSCALAPNIEQPVWTVTLAHPAAVDRYELYSTGDVECPLRWFTIEASDGKKLVQSRHISADHEAKLVYRMRFQRPSVVTKVKVKQGVGPETTDGCGGGKYGDLALCEFMAFGDSVCPFGKWGRECEHNCSCNTPSGACYVSTGTCVTGDNTLVDGSGCGAGCDRGVIGCEAGFWGTHCKHPCPEECSLDCDHTSGECHNGIQNGLNCSTGTWGPDCQQSCPHGCSKKCDPTSGQCLQCDDPSAFGVDCVQGHGETDQFLKDSPDADSSVLPWPALLLLMGLMIGSAIAGAGFYWIRTNQEDEVPVHSVGSGRRSSANEGSQKEVSMG